MIDSQWYFGKLRQVEAFQSRIADLYAIHSVLKSRIRRLKIERDKLLLRIEKSLNSEDWGSEEECDFRKALFKDNNVPVGRSYHDRWPGEENAEATEADEVSSDEEAKWRRSEIDCWQTRKIDAG